MVIQPPTFRFSKKKSRKEPDLNIWPILLSSLKRLRGFSTAEYIHMYPVAYLLYVQNKDSYFYHIDLRYDDFIEGWIVGFIVWGGIGYINVSYIL